MRLGIPLPCSQWCLPQTRRTSVPSERTEIEFVDLAVDTQTVGNEGFRGSYPIIHHPNPAVTAALAEVVGGGAVMENTCGFEDCSVVSANTGLVSLLRSGMAKPCVDPERDALAAQGMGGAPEGPRVRAWILRIDGTTVTEVSFDEVMASPDKASAALKRYCEKELVAPDPDVARHEGYCFSCDGKEPKGVLQAHVRASSRIRVRGFEGACVGRHIIAAARAAGSARTAIGAPDQGLGERLDPDDFHWRLVEVARGLREQASLDALHALARPILHDLRQGERAVGVHLRLRSLLVLPAR